MRMDTGLSFEDRLDKAMNFSPWKEWIMLLLEENEIWNIMEKTQTIPTNTMFLAAFTKKNVKAKRMLLDAVKDHIIPHVSRNKYAYEMWDALIKLYHSGNQNRKMVLREKLRSTKISKIDTVTSYLTGISHVCDDLLTIGEEVKDVELVRIALNEFLEKWAPFMKGFVAHENLPDWKRLWDDFS
jgi:hypothetical protein